MESELYRELVTLLNKNASKDNDEKMTECRELLKQAIGENAPFLVSVYKSDDDQNIAIQLLTNQDGMRVISMFTSEEESKKAWETTTIELGLRSVLEAVRDSEAYYDGVVINPFSNEITIYKSHLAELLGE